ncbi:MAG: bifunctional aspartate kinase/homoserine dehydrogenase I [Paludibacteraceae bacterium]|nr:bifunctional aspartate kinase/homoserine dehydrogenase I [Paludibacteraceae bacterium]MCR4619842.1 bifunctional aspartate kinase/homoserine dehydrogenase I [Paludibacteraceae bacterium]
MKVLKFGGSSVATAQNVLRVKEIVKNREEKTIVVVSALGGVTDSLISTATLAQKGDEAYVDALNEIVERHHEMMGQLASKDETRHKVEGLLSDLKDLLSTIVAEGELVEQTKNAIVSYGERLSSLIIADALDAEYAYAPDFIKTEINGDGKCVLNMKSSQELIERQFGNLANLTVVPGFIASDVESGILTNLGRGGSDYTAAILAARLGAEILEIWTDVDGFMTADPRVISKAYVIEKLSYIEAMELCNFGAKVIYPPTIFPVYHSNIPIVIKNTFNPSAPGTYISREKQLSERGIKGISSIGDTALVTMLGMGMVGVTGVSRRLYGALADKGISAFFISQAASENTISVGVKNTEAQKAEEALRDEFDEELKTGLLNEIKTEMDLATLAIVGEGMKKNTGVSGKLFGTLGRNGINVIAIAQGASETNISIVIKETQLRKALNVIHESFFLSEYQELNVFLCGIGTVGAGLLEQLRGQQQKLMEQNRLKIKIVGIGSSKKILFDRDGIDLKNYRQLLEEKGIENKENALVEGILGMNIFNSVFVDCTASDKVAGLYQKLLDNNVSVVAANKVAASGPYEVYESLKRTAREKGIKYLFETNVGAGLPIINTINDLINSGDRILRIEAVLSGTLNFIFNTLSEKVPLSKAIEMAREAGYAEPDPRIDLSGKDVVRKLVILAREAGYAVEQEDVCKNLFIPNRYFEGSLDEFWKTIPELDEQFELQRKELAKQDKKYRFVATLDNGECNVGLQEVGVRHPFYDLEGSNNIIMITTERYHDYPMIIKGYGAGAGVTAAGVFSDIISIANIR